MLRRIDDVLSITVRHLGIAFALVLLGGSIFILMLFVRAPLPEAWLQRDLS